MYLKSIIFSKLDIFITFSMQISIPAILKQKSFTTENFTDQYCDERRSKQSTTNQRSLSFLSSFLIGPRKKGCVIETYSVRSGELSNGARAALPSK